MEIKDGRIEKVVRVRMFSLEPCLYMLAPNSFDPDQNIEITGILHSLHIGKLS